MTLVAARTAGQCPVRAEPALAGAPARPSPAPVTPVTAARFVRSLPGHCRGLLGVSGDGPDAERHAELRRRPEPGQWSLLERFGSIRDVLHAGKVRLDRVFLGEGPRLAPITIDVPRPGDNDWDPRIILSCLTANADRLARSIEGAADDAWHRTGMNGAGQVTAIELVGDIVVELRRHLHEAVRAAGPGGGREQFEP